ncbi:MAG: Holliday junction resolvase RuvX [Candidatus Saccharimonadales bacterium]
MSPVEQILALDVGTKRVGIARASALAKLPEPLMTVNVSEAFSAIEKLVQTQPVAAIVIGLPRNLEGQDTAQTASVRQWAKKLKTKFDIPLYLQDEALTSKAAETSKVGRSSGIDALAAAIILEDFFNTPKEQRQSA